MILCIILWYKKIIESSSDVLILLKIKTKIICKTSMIELISRTPPEEVHQTIFIL